MTAGDRFTRSTFLRRSGAAGAALLGGSLWATSPAAARAGHGHESRSPIRNLVISCQENRSFDHYFGYAPQVQASGFGPPPGYSQPDSSGGRHVPFEFTSTSTPDISHSWASVHREWDGGRMDGFYEADGANALGYYTAASTTSRSATPTTSRCSGRAGSTIPGLSRPRTTI
jgi:phospholipase C